MITHLVLLIDEKMLDGAIDTIGWLENIVSYCQHFVHMWVFQL